MDFAWTKYCLIGLQKGLREMTVNGQGYSYY